MTLSACRDAVQHDRHAVADHLHLHRVPLLRAVRGRFGCGVVVEHVARQALRSSFLRVRSAGSSGCPSRPRLRSSSRGSVRSFRNFSPIRSLLPSAAPVRTPFSAVQFFAIAARASVCAFASALAFIALRVSGSPTTASHPLGSSDTGRYPSAGSLARSPLISSTA